jgi:hypothetical protein
VNLIPSRADFDNVNLKFTSVNKRKEERKNDHVNPTDNAVNIAEICPIGRRKKSESGIKKHDR